MTKEKCSIRLVRLSEEHTIAFKKEMQEAFQHGFMAYYKDDNQWQVLPDKDFYQSLKAEGAEAYEAVSEDGQRVGNFALAKSFSRENTRKTRNEKNEKVTVSQRPLSKN